LCTRLNSKFDQSYGYRGKDCRSNLFLIPTGEVVYFIAAVVVLFNVDEHGIYIPVLLLRHISPISKFSFSRTAVLSWAYRRNKVVNSYRIYKIFPFFFNQMKNQKIFCLFFIFQLDCSSQQTVDCIWSVGW
jgi:HELP motif